MNHQTELDHFISVFESLSKDRVSGLIDIYSAHAFFKDPFNEVHGLAAIIGIFNHMFWQVDEPKFKVTRSVLQNDDAFIVWDFSFRLKGSGKAQCIHGSSHLHFTPDHKVDYHRDYWDAAEELYEKIPLLGSLMRFLKRRVRS